MKKLVVIDTETGGLDSHEHSILTLGATIWDNGELVDTFHMHIHETIMATTPRAMEVNGITPEQLKNGQTPSFVVTAFEDWLHKHGLYGALTLGGHNIAGFDMGFIRRLYREAKRKFPFDYHTIDTMCIAGALKFVGKLNVPNLKLDTLCAHFGIVIREPGAAHRADQDAVATAKLFTELLRLMDQPTVPAEVASPS